MFGELKLVWEMRVEVGEELKAGKAAALGGAQRGERLAAELRSRLEKLPA
jgi:hypothetical protein